MPGNAAQTLAGWSRSRSLTEVPFAAAQLLIGFRAASGWCFRSFLGKTRMPLHQRRDVTVFCATNEIAFPMTGDGAVLDFCGAFPDGDGIYDLTARVVKDPRVLRAADAALGSQVPHQLFLQHSAGLNE